MGLLKLNFWEKVLVLSGALLFSISTAIYVSDFPLRRFFFDFEEVEAQKQVGVLGAQKGDVRRQMLGASEFNALSRGEPLYYFDVLVAGKDSTATLQLDDGALVELSPNTMVRLSFHTESGLGGLRRYGELHVVTGSVTAKTKTIALAVKNKNEIYKIAAHTRQSMSISESFHQQKLLLSKASPWNSPEGTLTDTSRDIDDSLLPRAQGSPSSTPKALSPLLIVPGSSPSPSPLPRVLVSPSVLPRPRPSAFHRVWPKSNPMPSPKPSPKSSPRPSPTPSPKPIPRVLPPVKLLPALVGGRATVSNQLSGKLLKSFDIQIRWEKYPGAKNYRVWLGASANAIKPLVEKVLDSNDYLVNRGKVFSGKFYYRIYALLLTGEVAVSTTEVFSFSFLPPIPAIPKDETVLSKSALLGNGNRILLTWQKTNFTKKYEIEIARDSGFVDIVAKKIFSENYFLMLDPQVSSYWWRVRGFTSELSSPFSRPARFTVNP